MGVLLKSELKNYFAKGKPYYSINTAYNYIRKLYWYVPGIPHWTESPLDGIPTRITCSGDSVPWCPESPLHGIPTDRLTSRLLMYFNLALQRHYEDKLHCVLLFVASYQGLETEEMRGYSCQGLANPGMG